MARRRAGFRHRPHARRAPPGARRRDLGRRRPIRPGRRLAARIWLGLWVVAAVLVAVVGTVTVFPDSGTVRRGEISGTAVMVLVCLLLAWPGYVRLRARRPPATRPHPRPGRSRRRVSSPATRVRTNVSLRQLASLAAAERALGDALYRLDLRRAALDVDRSVAVAARAAGLDAAAALRARTTAVPHAHMDAYQQLVDAVEALLAGTGSAAAVSRATDRLAARAAGLAGGARGKSARMSTRPYRTVT